MKLAIHVAPQLIPAGVLVTVPAPVPLRTTARITGEIVKLAVTLSAEFIVSMQDDVPVHGPDHPVNVEPIAGVALRVMTVPCATSALQVGAQLIPAGELATLPAPVPPMVTKSVCDATPKAASTVADVFIVTVQGPVPVQAPLQPLKLDPLAGAAESVTKVD